MCKLYRLFPDYTQVGNLLGGETIKIVWMGGMCEVTAGGKKKTTQKEKLYLVGIYLEIEMNAKCRFPPPCVVIPALSPNQTTLPRHKVSTWIITEAETHKSMKSMIVWLCARALPSVFVALSWIHCLSAAVRLLALGRTFSAPDRWRRPLLVDANCFSVRGGGDSSIISTSQTGKCPI